MDYQPLLDTLSKVSDGRVLPYGDYDEEGDLKRLKIPVQAANPGDKTDRVLRTFARDWIRLRVKDIGTDARLEQLPAGTSYYKDGKEFHVIAAIVLTWWPRPSEPEFEILKRQQREWKGTRPP